MMTKKALLVLTLLGLLLVGACPKPARLVRLTVVNKSGLPIEINMTGSVIDKYNNKNQYYLRLQKNDPRGSLIREFTVTPDKYSMQFYYIELWDPVYGYKCKSASQTIEIFHNTRVTVPDCKYQSANPGEPSMVKIKARRGCHLTRAPRQPKKPGC